MSENPIPERMAVAERDIEDLQDNREKLWDKVGKLADGLNGLRVQVARTQVAIGIIQTIVLAVIVWKLKG